MTNMTDHATRMIKLPDGYNAHARVYHANPCRGAVLYIHGIQSHCGWYDQSARRMQTAGFTVLAPDRRGSGQNTVRRGHADSTGQLVDDAIASLDQLKEITDHPKIHLVGISWGGKLVAATHIARPESTASICMITPGLFPLVGVSKAEMFRIGMSMLHNPDKLYDIPLNDPALFTSDPEWLEFLKNDPLQIHQATAGFYLASRRMDKIVNKLHHAPPVPLHLMLAADERIIDNDKTTEFVRKLNWPDIRFSNYPNSRHTLEFDPDREQFFTDLVDWLEHTNSTNSEQSIV